MLVVRGTLPSCSTERCCRATNGCARPLLGDGPADHRRHHRHRDRRGQDPPENASALVAAGILSVLLFPALGLGRLRATRFAFVHEASTDEDASGSGSTDMRHPMLSVHREPTSRKEVR